MLVKFVVLLIGIPLIALSLIITLAILKTGWDIISGKKPPDDSTKVQKSVNYFNQSDTDGKDL